MKLSLDFRLVLVTSVSYCCVFCSSRGGQLGVEGVWRQRPEVEIHIYVLYRLLCGARESNALSSHVMCEAAGARGRCEGETEPKRATHAGMGLSPSTPKTTTRLL